MRVASASMARFGVTFPALACGGGIAGLGLRVLGVDLRVSRRQQQEGEEGARVRRGTVSRLAHAWATLLGQLVEAQQVDICLSNFAAFFQVVPARMRSSKSTDLRQ